LAAPLGRAALAALGNFVEASGRGPSAEALWPCGHSSAPVASSPSNSSKKFIPFIRVSGSATGLCGTLSAFNRPQQPACSPQPSPRSAYDKRP